jgi:alanine racemase
MWPLQVEELSRIVGGRLHAADDSAARRPLQRVLTDSRAGVRPEDVFWGLAGPHFDGGRFASQALADGAAAAVVSPAHGDAVVAALRPGQAVIVVDHPLQALQALAAEARRRFAGRVIAITGSTGKTTVKDMLHEALAGDLRVTASPQSYNSQVGVALSLLGLDPAAEVAIIECGISLPGEMARLQAMVRPDFGILTAIGDAHLEGLGSREVTAREKARLFAALPDEGWVLVPAGEELGSAALEKIGAPLLTVASPLRHRADFELQEDGGTTVLRHGRQRVPLELAVPGAPLLQDAALAAAAALLLGASEEGVARGLRQWRPAPMRLEISTTPRGLTLINDAYTADPVSVEAALEVLRRERSSGAAVAVLGGLAQLGAARAAAHERVGRRVAQMEVDRLVVVGDGGAEIAAAARAAGLPEERIETAADIPEAAMILDEICRPGDRVLLKASRPERLERLAAMLFDSVAPARLYVDLDRVLGNYRRIHRAVGRQLGIMAMVKSFGYGLDAVRVARALEQAGIAYFAVAYPDEGVTLRDRGITTPILVQNLLHSEVDKFVRHGLTAQVVDGAQIDWLEEEAERQRRAVRVHLKIDTGMGRAGAFVAETARLARRIADSEWLLLEGLMTHFAAADDPSADDFTRQQIDRFDQAREALRQEGLAVRWEHAANSATIARFPEAHYSMVRTGLALFGYSQVDERLELGQEPALRLVTQVVSVKELPPGHAVGYGLTWATDQKPHRIAVVALGYSDGYPWALSNRGWMSLHGERCPVVGRVCMDVTMLDVTALGDRVQPGDEVIVFGPEDHEPDLLALAEDAGTIPYELLTRISPRVRRIFRSSH